MTSLVKKYLATETHYRTIFDLDNKPSIKIQNEYASNKYSKDMLVSNVSVDEDIQSFETTI